jgi:hypothetical protein
VSKPCGTGIAISPPDRKLASWPVSVVSVGSASIRARRFSRAMSSAMLNRLFWLMNVAKKP